MSISIKKLVMSEYKYQKVKINSNNNKNEKESCHDNQRCKIFFS